MGTGTHPTPPPPDTPQRAPPGWPWRLKAPDRSPLTAEEKESMPKYRRGSGSVYKRGKTWWIAYYGPDGKQVCESAKTKDKAEARNTLQSKIGQRAEGRLVIGADKVTFDDLAEMILTDYRVNGKKSLSDVQTRIKEHLAPFFAGKKAHDITSVTVQAYVAKRLEQGACNGTINRELAALKRMFNLALQAEKIT